MTATFTPLLVAALIAVWSLFQGRLSRSAQRLRLQLADKGERLLARDDLSAETRRDVEFMLNTAFSRWGMLLFVIVAAPFMVAYMAVQPKVRAQVERDYSLMSADVRAQYSDVRNLHNRIIMANHPFLSSFVLLEVTILLVPFALIMMAFQRDTFSSPVDRYAFINIVEMQEQTLMAKFRHRENLATC